MCDVRVTDQGSAVLLTPLTTAAIDWVEDHLSSKEPTWGGAVTLGSHRGRSVIRLMEMDGLECAA